MAALHEVIGRDGSVLYRGGDVDRAVEVFQSAKSGARLRCRRGVDMDAPVPFVPSPIDEPIGFSLTATGHAAVDEAVFVVDTANVAVLRKRCPALFAPRPGGGAA